MKVNIIKRRIINIQLALILFCGILNSINNTNAEIAFDNIPFAFLYFSDFSKIKLDGQINDNEYPDGLKLNDVNGEFVANLSWGHNNTHLAIAIQTQATGWLGIGLGPEGVSMDGANIIMASVNNNMVYIEDMSSVGQKKPSIDEDSSISCEKTINMEYVNGSEGLHETIIEFIIPMQSNDSIGRDHNWEINGTYGFFVAYQKSSDNFGFTHTTHTQSLSVKILDSSYTTPNFVQQEMSLSIVKETVKVVSTLSSNTVNVSGLKIAIYKKLLFGKILLGLIETDKQGVATFTFTIDKIDQITIISLLPGNEYIKRNEIKKTLNNGLIDGQNDQNEIIFNDLRGTFNDEHLMRSFILFWYFMVIASVLMIYFSVFADLLKIFKLRHKKQIKNSKIEVLKQ